MISWEISFDRIKKISDFISQYIRILDSDFKDDCKILIIYYYDHKDTNVLEGSFQIFLRFRQNNRFSFIRRHCKYNIGGSHARARAREQPVTRCCNDTYSQTYTHSHIYIFIHSYLQKRLMIDHMRELLVGRSVTRVNIIYIFTTSWNRMEW